MKKIGHHTFKGVIRCLSGIHIGGSDDLLQIGGTDLTCIKHPVTFKPYIPGSSLKGKMRSELEKKLGKFGGQGRNEPCGCATKECLVCRVFGPHKQSRHQLGPTRIIVRDSQLLDGGQTELKPENVIDRRTGTAMHPRKVERVSEGTTFSLSIGLQVLAQDDDVPYNGSKGAQALIEFIMDGLREVQNTGIGAGVSKGSGHIEFQNLTLDDQPVSL